MKSSFYNVLVPREDGVVVYNVLHRSIAKLSHEEAAALASLDETGECADTALLEALVDAHFVCDDPEAEADEIDYRRNRYRYNNNTLEITISPTRMCNFDCNYCYIKKRPGLMSEETQERVEAFVRDRYTTHPFKRLKIIWYGGEPLLGLSVIRSLSKRLMAFCDEVGIPYIGHALSNLSLADAATSRILAEECGFVSIMPTFSGEGDMQDYQRCAVNGKKYFDTIMENVDHLLDNGIIVHTNYVVNYNNFESCVSLLKKLCHREGVVTRLTRTFPFGKDHIYLDDEDHTEMKLFPLEGFRDHYIRFVREQELDAAGYEDLLSPLCLYCAAWANDNYFIDEVGDVFCCMVDMDYSTCALFNLADWEPGYDMGTCPRYVEYANIELMRDPQCRRCPVLPICQGGCAYNYLEGEHSCHDLKFSIDLVVSDYYDALVREGKA